MNHVSESLSWSYLSLFGAALGYALHVVMSWGEWRKVGNRPDMSLLAFLINDPPTQITGVIVVVFIYCSLSVASQIEVLKLLIGFQPKVDFFSAFVTALASQSIGVKMANMLKKKLSGPEE